MAKFQVKYPLELDLEATRERSRKLKALVSSVQYRNLTDSQLRIELRDLEATILVSPKTVQVYWTGEYKKIEKVETILLEILEPTPVSLLKSIRVSVPSIVEERYRAGLFAERIELMKEDKRLSVIIAEQKTLLEIAHEKIRQMGTDPLTLPEVESEENVEEVIRRSKKLLSTP